jgi:antitoxin CcdA
MPNIALRQKKTVSVTLEPALYKKARQAGINLSATLAEALKNEIRYTEGLQWKRSNEKALQELNRITNEHGLISDEYRTF